MRIEILPPHSLNLEELNDFFNRRSDLKKLEDLPPSSENSEIRIIRVNYCANGKVSPFYEIQDFDPEGRFIGKPRYFSPEDLK
jgi:hypothetical protein